MTYTAHHQHHTHAQTQALIQSIQTSQYTNNHLSYLQVCLYYPNESGCILSFIREYVSTGPILTSTHQFQTETTNYCRYGTCQNKFSVQSYAWIQKQALEDTGTGV